MSACASGYRPPAAALFKLAIAAAIVLFLVVGTCASVYVPGAEYTTKLTDGNFDDTTANDRWLLDFYAPWCSHCQKLEPIIQEVAAILEGTMQVGKIDCTVEKALCKRFGVKSYPTIKFFRDGVDGLFTGLRTKEEIVAFAKTVSGPPVHKLVQSKLAVVMTKAPVVFIYLGSGAVNKSLRSFERLALKLQGSAFVCSPFGTLLPPQTEEKIAEDDTTERTEMAPDSKDFKLAEVVRNNLMKKLKLQLSLAELDNGALVRLAKGEAPEVLEGPFDGVPLMEEWVKQRMLPLVPVVTGANFGDLLRMKKRLAFIVTDPMVPNGKRFLESMFPLALYYRGDFTFGALDAQMYSHYVEQFNVRSYPTVFVFDSDNEVYYVDDTPLPMFSDVTDESLPFSSTVPSDLYTAAPLPPSYLKPRAAGAASADDYAVRGLFTRTEHIRFLEKVKSGELSSRAVLAWYNPGRYKRSLERLLSNLDEGTLIAIVSAMTLGFGGLMIYVFFYLGAPDKEEQELLRRFKQEQAEKKETEAASAAAKATTNSDAKKNK